MVERGLLSETPGGVVVFLSLMYILSLVAVVAGTRRHGSLWLSYFYFRRNKRVFE